ncbi:methyltransferase domain-containing protein [Pseudomonadota bacterium]
MLENGLLSIPGKRCRVLHVAPTEQALRELFESKGNYTAGDLNAPSYKDCGVLSVDLTNLSNFDSFDLIYASHVLEHIDDDKLVFDQMYEHIDPGGEAWILVPLRNGTTKDGQIDMSPSEREREFGQWDHVRLYGRDIVDRLSLAGFSVRTIDPRTIHTDIKEKHGFDLGDVVFVAKKNNDSVYP